MKSNYMDYRNDGCGCFYPALVIFGLLYLLYSGVKDCRCSSHSTQSSKESYNDRYVREMHERQLEQDRRNGNCENCHGRGYIIFCHNEGKIINCTIDNESSRHDHVKCDVCNGTGKSN